MLYSEKKLCASQQVAGKSRIDKERSAIQIKISQPTDCTTESIAANIKACFIPCLLQHMPRSLERRRANLFRQQIIEEEFKVTLNAVLKCICVSLLRSYQIVYISLRRRFFFIFNIFTLQGNKISVQHKTIF